MIEKLLSSKLIPDELPFEELFKEALFNNNEHVVQKLIELEKITPKTKFQRITFKSHQIGYKKWMQQCPIPTYSF